MAYREEGLDVLLCKIMARPGDEECVAARIVARLWEERPMLNQHSDVGLTGPVIVEFVDLHDMQVNDRMSKLLVLVDNRHKRYRSLDSTVNMLWKTGLYRMTYCYDFYVAIIGPRWVSLRVKDSGVLQAPL